VSHDASHDTKEQVRQAVDIVELVGSYIQLRREGRGYKGLCPWHDDKRPSMQVNPERQSFKCWVCDIGGDVFTFVQKMEGVGFAEALAMLADRAGVKLNAGRGNSSGDGSASDRGEQKRMLFQCQAWAEQQYLDCLLKAPEAEAARAYLAERGISDESIQRFRLGFAPDSWDWILNRAKGTPFTPQIMEAVGLVGQRRSGQGHYDRFKGRVLFSIRDNQGRPVGLGGRVLPGAGDSNAAKYINSPETVLFAKSKLLYGLDLARQAMRKSQTALVMEGYTDCIVAQQSGFENAVAVLGTALGEEHVRQLKQYADRIRIVLVLDGDEAGRKRANEVLKLFVAENVDLRVCTLVGQKDPCDFLLENGPEAFEACVQSAPDALEHARRVKTAGVDLSRDVHRSSEALSEMLAIIAQAPRYRDDTTTEDRLREEKMLQRLSFDFRIPEEDLRKQMTSLRSKAAKALTTRSNSAHAAGGNSGRSGGTLDSNAQDSNAKGSTAGAAGEYSTNAGGPSERPVLDAWERELIELLLQQPEGIPEVLQVVRPDQFSVGPLRELFTRCAVLTAAGVPPTVERLMLEINDPAEQSLVVELDESGRAKGRTESAGQMGVVERLRSCLERFRHRQEDQEHRLQLVALRDRTMDEDEAKKVLEQMILRKRNRQGISVPTDG
jgi:DNA primase